MPEEIQATVKIPLSEIVASLRKKHGLPSKLTGARIEGNIIVLNFAEGGQEPLELVKSQGQSMENEAPKEMEEPLKNEEPMEIVEAMSEEQTEDEEARERKRFWKK